MRKGLWVDAGNFFSNVGLDRRLGTLLTWRTEARALVNRDAIFADRRAASGVSRTNLVAVTSLALSF